MDSQTNVSYTSYVIMMHIFRTWRNMHLMSFSRARDIRKTSYVIRDIVAAGHAVEPLIWTHQTVMWGGGPMKRELEYRITILHDFVNCRRFPDML